MNPSPARRHVAGLRVLFALVLALLAGIVLAAWGNATALRVTQALQLIGTLWVNAIRMTVIPLVVSLLITGIASVAEIRNVGRLGVRTIAVFAALLVVSAIVSVLVAPALFAVLPWGPVIPVPPGAADAARDVAASGATGLAEWFVTLIPVNPVAAAASGNMVSLIVFVFLLALATARTPAADTRATLVRFFAALGEALLLLVRWIIAAAPVAVFCLVLPLATQAGASLAGAVGLYLAAFAATCAAVTAVLYPIVVLAGHTTPGSFARAVLPAQLIGISCSSSVATLPAMVESANTLGVAPRVSGFVLPLAVSVFKPAAAPAWIAGALFVGRVYGVALGARELLILAVASVLVSFAAPGVPRGAFLLLTPLFTAIGLPAEGIGVLIAVDLVPDMCATVVNVTGDVVATRLVDEWASRRVGQRGE